MSNDSNRLAYVRSYISLGLRVVPVWGVDDLGACLCRAGSACTSTGKHPIPKNGLHDATTDLAVLERWWREHPGANIGIATSADFAIVDVDVKNGGLATLDALIKQHGVDAFDSPYRVRSGSGGLHLAFKAPAGTGSRNGVMPGIDRKVEGGMIVAPGSRNAMGFYLFEPPVTVLDLNALKPMPAMFLPTSTPTSTASTPGKIDVGRRNSALTSLAGKLRDLGAGAPEIESAIKHVNQTTCSVPLADAEVLRIVASIAKYPAGVQPSISFIGADELVAAVPPHMDWIVPGLLALGFVTEIIGHPKSGKSTFVREMVAAMLQQRPFLGLQVRPCRVLMLSEERDGTLSYALSQHGIATQDVRVLQRHRITGHLSWPDTVDAALAEAKRFGAQLLIVDTLPFWALGDADENSAAEGMKAMEPLLRAAAEGLAVLSLRHMRKSGGDTVSAARGASSITGAVDIVCTMTAHNGGDTFREIESTGRVRDSKFKAVIELTTSGYVSHGNGRQVAQHAQQALEKLIISLLPKDEASAISEKQVVALLATTSNPFQRTKVADVLKELVANKAISWNGRGTSTEPKRYWAP